MPNKKRTESDSLGVKIIDSKRLWGAQTQRSLENFKIGNNSIPKEIINALGQQKKACALANEKLGLLNKKISNAIKKAFLAQTKNQIFQFESETKNTDVNSDTNFASQGLRWNP